MRSIIIIGLVSAFAGGAPVAAQEVRIATVPVHVSDRADPAALRARIAKVIAASCGTYAAAPYAEWTDIAACRRSAKAASERQIAEMIGRDRNTRIAAAR